MDKEMQIVIVNAHWNNRGDEAAHYALWQKLQQLFPEAQKTIMFKDHDEITWFPEDIEATYFSCQFKASEDELWQAIVSEGELATDKKLELAVRTLRGADLIIYSPGGSVINDRFYWSKQLEYLMPFMCAKLYGIPIFICSPSIGPFQIENPLRQYLLREATQIVVRENISKKYLSDIGVTQNVDVAIDLAFMSEIDFQRAETLLNRDQDLGSFIFTPGLKTIGMTITDFKWHVKFGKDLELQANIQDTCRKFIAHVINNGYQVLLIPQLFGNQNDSELLQDFADGERVFIMNEDYDANFQQFIISKLHVVIGMRYHCNIFSAKMGVPFIALSYEEKMNGFMESAGLSQYALNINELTLEKVVEKLDYLETNYDAFRNALRGKLSNWKQSGKIVMSKIETCIQKISSEK